MRVGAGWAKVGGMSLNSSTMTIVKAAALAIPLAGVALAPGEAEACSPDPCWAQDVVTSLEPVNAAAIPTDGVLLLQGAQNNGSPDQDWMMQVDLTVTRDGQPIAGAIESSPVRDLLVWRPSEPLAPGATYKVTGSLDNPEHPYYDDYDCGPDILMLDFEFHVDEGPSAPLSAPKTSADESVQLAEHRGLEDLVCCDGAMPVEYYFDCGGSGGYVEWGEGSCSSLRGFGTLKVGTSAEIDVPAATAAMVTQQLFVDGTAGTTYRAGLISISDSKPFCTAIALRNLATGEVVMSEETCHGAGVAGELGEQDIDPGAALAEKCAGAAYVCVIDEDNARWDETQCTPWPAAGETTGEIETSDGPTTGGPGTSASGGADTGEDTGEDTGSASGGQDGLVDHGCACDSTTPSPLGLLGLLGLGLLRRRRRR